MKRLWHRLKAIDTCVLLLLLTTFWLMAGSVTMRIYPQAFRPLLHTFLLNWLEAHFSKPLLWWWMVPLFITVTFLGLSTAACTIEGLISLKKAKTGATIRYHLGIALFHIGVIIFLLGHLFMEFTGDRLLYALKESVVVNVDEADLTVTLAKSEKVRLSASPDEPERVKLVLHVTKGEESETIQPAELSPAHAFGWDFHLSMGGSKKKGPGTVIEIRRNPGILWLIAGCFVLTGGILLTAPRLVAR